MVLPAGEAVECAPADWGDTLIVVKGGDVELECCSGRRARFGSGAVLTLAALPVRRLVNPGGKPILLLVVTRVARVDD